MSDRRVAFVTGASSGIGLAVTRTLAEQGMAVYGCARDAGKLAETLEKLTAEGLEVAGGPCDVTSTEGVRAAVAAAVERFGRIDILVNNAGIVHNIPSEEVPDEEWLAVISVNLNGVFWCCREVGKAMLERGSGSIVNVASMSGIISNHPQPQAAYNASKAAVITLTKSLAGEWAYRGVRVNSVSPGYIRTPLTELGMSRSDWSEVWLSQTPMGRLAEPEEIAPAVLYLASEAASFATGTNLVIDGGYTSW
jgi:NAD(P)-dependent dehydrogenase (short-subunit alcohol dehydrogenase family)